MKKILVLFFIMSMFIIMPNFAVSADVGPKRSLEVVIEGVEEPYFFEILRQGALPQDEALDDILVILGERGIELPSMLHTFYENGYVSNTLVSPWHIQASKVTDHHYYHGYNAPSTFKLILIFEDGTYVTSRPFTSSLFNSKVIWDLSNVDLTSSKSNQGSIEEVFPVRTMTFELTGRIVATIGIELLVLFLFGYSMKKSFTFVAMVNVATQVTLTGFMFAMRYFYAPVIGEIIVLTIGEILIFAIEITLFAIFLKEHSKRRAVLYAITANTISLLAGLSLMILMLNL